jgi:hypothetical protein
MANWRKKSPCVFSGMAMRTENPPKSKWNFAATRTSGTHWKADCDSVAPVARSHCCWWSPGTRAVERFSAVAAICLAPTPGQRSAPSRHQRVVPRAVLPPLRGARPTRCTASPTLALRFLPAPVDVSTPPAAKRTELYTVTAQTM